LEKLKDAATRCVLRPVDTSKCICGRGSATDPAEGGGAYSAPRDSPAGFGGAGWGTERARDGKGTKGEEKEGEGKGESRGGGMELGGCIIVTSSKSE